MSCEKWKEQKKCSQVWLANWKMNNFAKKNGFEQTRNESYEITRGLLNWIFSKLQIHFEIVQGTCDNVGMQFEIELYRFIYISIGILISRELVVYGTEPRFDHTFWYFQDYFNWVSNFRTTWTSFSNSLKSYLLTPQKS